MNNWIIAIILTVIIFGISFLVAWAMRPSRQKPSTEKPLSVIDAEYAKQRERIMTDFNSRLEGSYKDGKRDAINQYLERHKK